MDSKEPNKYLYEEKMKAVAQLKRRNTYSQISSNRRKELLLARRMKKNDSAKHTILQNSTIAVPKQPTSSWCRPQVPKQVALTIREPLPVIQKVVRPQPIPDNNKAKGKDLCTPFVINETETIKSSTGVKEATECLFERNIIVTEEDLLLQTKLNTQQRIAYDTILNRIFSNKSGAFFIDGPGGTDDDDDHSTHNIVYNKIIQKAFT